MSDLPTVQHVRATAARWTALNPVLLAGQIGIELVTQKAKAGDGTRHWNDLPYIGAVGAGGDIGVPEHTHVIADIIDLELATTETAGLVELAKDGEDAAGLAVQANDQRLVTVESLERKYLLLLKHFVVLGLPAPVGLEDDVPLALAME